MEVERWISRSLDLFRRSGLLERTPFKMRTRAAGAGEIKAVLAKQAEGDC